MQPAIEEWELWTWREVATALKVSRSWVYAKAESGVLPSLRIAGLLRFDPMAVRRFATPGEEQERLLRLNGLGAPKESS
jgi:excisionase family DNA binding protein